MVYRLLSERTRCKLAQRDLRIFLYMFVHLYIYINMHVLLTQYINTYVLQLCMRCMCKRVVLLLGSQCSCDPMTMEKFCLHSLSVRCLRLRVALFINRYMYRYSRYINARTILVMPLGWILIRSSTPLIRERKPQQRSFALSSRG